MDETAVKVENMALHEAFDKSRCGIEWTAWR
jgi:hypothetical protein